MTGKIKKIISIENGDNFAVDIEDIENRITQNSSNLETAKQRFDKHIVMHCSYNKSFLLTNME